MCSDVGDVDILNLYVDGSEDFSDIDPDLAYELLGESPEEMIGNWVARCNRDVTAGLDKGTQPDLESGFRDLDLADSVTPEATTSAASIVTHAPAAPLSPAASEMDTTEGRPTTIAAQPGLSIHQDTFQINGVGEFNQDNGQPISLNAYPPVVRPKEPLREDPDQVYRGQDLVDPAVIWQRLRAVRDYNARRRPKGNHRPSEGFLSW